MDRRACAKFDVVKHASIFAFWKPLASPAFTKLLSSKRFSELAQAQRHGLNILCRATYKIDGQAYLQYSQTNLAEFSVTGAKPGTNSYRLLSPNTVEVTARNNTGNVTSITANVVSADGKTITATAKDATGKVTNVTVWDKQ